MMDPTMQALSTFAEGPALLTLELFMQLQMTTQFLLLHIVKEQDPKVQAALCQGMAKLVISGLVTDIEVCP